MLHRFLELIQRYALIFIRACEFAVGLNELLIHVIFKHLPADEPDEFFQVQNGLIILTFLFIVTCLSHVRSFTLDHLNVIFDLTEFHVAADSLHDDVKFLGGNLFVTVTIEEVKSFTQL